MIFYLLVKLCKLLLFAFRKSMQPWFRFDTHVTSINILSRFFVFILIVAGVVLGLLVREQAILSGIAATIFEILFIVLFILSKLLQDIQRVYLFFRLFRNPAYPKTFSTESDLKERYCALLNLLFHSK